jgi:hypothetical protein
MHVSRVLAGHLTAICGMLDEARHDEAVSADARGERPWLEVNIYIIGEKRGSNVYISVLIRYLLFHKAAAAEVRKEMMALRGGGSTLSPSPALAHMDDPNSGRKETITGATAGIMINNSMGSPNNHVDDDEVRLCLAAGAVAIEEDDRRVVGLGPRQQRRQQRSKSRGRGHTDGQGSPKLNPIASAQPSSASSTHYYFYQSSLGDHVYLHPLETKVLKHEFGGYDRFPESIAVEVVGVQESTVVSIFVCVYIQLIFFRLFFLFLVLFSNVASSLLDGGVAEALPMAFTPSFILRCGVLRSGSPWCRVGQYSKVV